MITIMMTAVTAVTTMTVVTAMTTMTAPRQRGSTLIDVLTVKKMMKRECDGSGVGKKKTRIMSRGTWVKEEKEE